MDSFYIWHKWSLSLEGVSRVTFFFSEPGNLNFWQFLKNFRPWPWKKSSVLDGFFQYLARMITSIRWCVAYNDLWPWPIFSRSFGLGLENRVRSVASTVRNGLFPYLVQMITSMRRCVACDDLWPWPVSSRSLDLVLTWDPTWLNSVGNHEAAGVSSERRRSSCSSWIRDIHNWDMDIHDYLMDVNIKLWMSTIEFWTSIITNNDHG